VSVICDAILEELLAHYSTTHSQSILTAHLSKIPPDIASAILVIANLKGTLPNTTSANKLDENSNLVRSAIEHICFLADVNHLYDEALGLYRLDIALLIAQKSQKVFPILRLGH
jgi:elongator complex protein 1